MFVHWRTQGLIIKKEDIREADQLFTIYTKDFGKLEILGKGIRKISSKLRGGADIFYLSEIEFIQGKSYKTLTDAVCVKNFPNLKKDLKKLAVAYQISDTLSELVFGQEPDEEIWQLLKETFEKLDKLELAEAEPHLAPVGERRDKSLLSPHLLRSLGVRRERSFLRTPRPAKRGSAIGNRKLEIIYYYFFWNLVSLLGYKPEINNCALQGKSIDCDVIKIIKIILKKDWQILLRLKLEDNHLKLLKNISKWYKVVMLDR